MFAKIEMGMVAVEENDSFADNFFLVYCLWE